MTREQILKTLPFLATASKEFRRAFFEKSMDVVLPGGKVICLEHNQCVHLPIVLDGTARVYKANDEGKELTLYRIEAGESCILTASCILNQIEFPANAIADSDISAIVVSPVDVRNWMQLYPEWRQYIFELISKRLASVIELVEEVAFQRMDERLMSYLYEASMTSEVIKKTHESIATDLGTSREVVSRLLKQLEIQGILLLSRGVVQILERDKLA